MLSDLFPLIQSWEFENGRQEIISHPRHSGEGCFSRDKAVGAECHTLHVAVERMEIYLDVACNFSRRRVQVEGRFATIIETTMVWQGCGR